ncbi:MAG TPA: hypothetical protein VFP78_05910 [Solirubrobacteraceae bacterium]|nr:hypothetical protein [Solirubrobacteraceae bacterium]
MRIPFIHRRERTIEEIAAKATRVGSAEGYPPRLGPNTRTVAENREAIARMRRIRADNGLR